MFTFFESEPMTQEDFQVVALQTARLLEGGPQVKQEVADKIRRFVKLRRRMATLRDELAKVQTDYADLEDELEPIIFELDEHMVNMDNVVVRVEEYTQTLGATSVRYTEALPALVDELEEYQEGLGEVVEEAWERIAPEHRKRSEPVKVAKRRFKFEDNILSSLWNWIKGVGRKLLDKLHSAEAHLAAIDEILDQVGA